MYPGEPHKTEPKENQTQKSIILEEEPTLERKLSFCNICLSGLLVRVGAISQSNPLDRPSELIFGQFSTGVLMPEVTTDSFVVSGSHFKSFQSELAANLLANISVTLVPCLQELGVIRGV